MTPTKQTIYLPVKIEDELPTHKVCALNESNMLVGHLKHLGKGVIRPIVYVEDEHQEMGNVTHWLKPQEGYFFTQEQLNQFISDVIKDTLETAAKEADSFVDVDESTHIEGNVWCNIDKESITSTFDITYKKHKI